MQQHDTARFVGENLPCLTDVSKVICYGKFGRFFCTQSQTKQRRYAIRTQKLCFEKFTAESVAKVDVYSCTNEHKGHLPTKIHVLQLRSFFLTLLYRRFFELLFYSSVALESTFTKAKKRASPFGKARNFVSGQMTVTCFFWKALPLQVLPLPNRTRLPQPTKRRFPRRLWVEVPLWM